MKFKTYSSTVQALERFFSNTLESKVSNEEVYQAWERDPSDKAKNKSWLSNYLTHITHHELAQPIYAMKNNRKMQVGIKLTEKGERALGRGVFETHSEATATTTTQIPTSTVQDLTYGTMVDLVQRFFREHSEYQEVGFRVKSKDGESITDLKRNGEK